MATAKDRLTIFENVIARVGIDGDVLGEYSKALLNLNGMQSFAEMTPPVPPAPPVDNTLPAEQPPMEQPPMEQPPMV